MRRGVSRGRQQRTSSPCPGPIPAPPSFRMIYVHLAVALALPSAPRSMEPVDNIPNVQRERWELTCCLCRQRYGAKIQCGQCYQAGPRSASSSCEKLTWLPASTQTSVPRQTELTADPAYSSCAQGAPVNLAA